MDLLCPTSRLILQMAGELLSNDVKNVLTGDPYPLDAP